MVNTPPIKLRMWLIFRASDQSLRTNRRRPDLAWDEIAWEVNVTVPMPWARMAGSIDIVLPDVTPDPPVVTNVLTP